MCVRQWEGIYRRVYIAGVKSERLFKLFRVMMMMMICLQCRLSEVDAYADSPITHYTIWIIRLFLSHLCCSACASVKTIRTSRASYILYVKITRVLYISDADDHQTMFRWNTFCLMQYISLVVSLPNDILNILSTYRCFYCFWYALILIINQRREYKFWHEEKPNFAKHEKICVKKEHAINF